MKEKYIRWCCFSLNSNEYDLDTLAYSKGDSINGLMQYWEEDWYTKWKFEYMIHGWRCEKMQVNIKPA